MNLNYIWINIIDTSKTHFINKMAGQVMGNDLTLTENYIFFGIGT